MGEGEPAAGTHGPEPIESEELDTEDRTTNKRVVPRAGGSAEAAGPSGDGGNGSGDGSPPVGRPIWLRAALVIAPAAAGIPLAFGRHYLEQLVGQALCLIAAYGLIPQLAETLGPMDRPWRLGRRTIRWMPGGLAPLVLLGVAAGLLWPTLLGMMPQSQDHPVHLTRLWHFVSKNLGHFQLSGWSDLWFAGWPAGEDYPPGGDWWGAALYLATFGVLGWEATYGLAFMLMLGAVACCIYWFGRVHFGRLAGLVGGLAFLLDRGAYREGGWNYTVYWGVWPQVLCTGATFLAWALLDRVLRRARPRDYALCGLVTGYAFLAHPIAIVYFGLGLPIYLVARALATDEPAGRVIARALGAVAIGGALSAFWVLSFTSKSAWMATYGELWKPIGEMAAGLWSGELFQHATPPVIALAALGGGVAAWRRDFAGVFLTALAAITLFIAASSTFQRLDLLTVAPSFGQIQYQRFSILAKPCLYLLCGIAVSAMFRRLGGRRWTFTWKGYALGCLLILAVTPYVQPTAVAWAKRYGSELGSVKTRESFSYWDQYRAFLRWSADLHRREKQFYRIAYVRPYNDHFFAAAPVYNDTPAYKVGFTPASNFVHKPDVADPALYRVLSVKYVVALGPQGGSQLDLVRRFGPIHVYAFAGYSPKRYTLEGPGKVEVERFDPAGDGIALRVRGASPRSRLILHIANYPSWQASVGGESLPITTGRLGDHAIFLSVPAKNGLIELDYRWTAADWLGVLLSWTALGVLALLALSRFRPRWVAPVRARLAPLGRFAERHGVALGIVVLLAPFGALAFSAASKPQRGGRTIIEQLDRAVVEVVSPGGGVRRCRKRPSGRHQCSERSWNYVGASSQRAGEALRRCIWAHPIEGGKIRIEIPVELGKAVSGHHGLTDMAVRQFAGGAPVRLDVLVDGKELGSFTCNNEKGWKPWRVDTSARAGQHAELAFVISTSRAGGRHYCFDAVIEK